MARERVKRASINGTRNVLTVKGQEPGYHYRIVNDIGDRIEEFKDRGYELVVDSKIRIGDRRVNSPTAEGTPQQISVGGGNKAYLMRIKDEWYQEDKAAKANNVDETEKAIKEQARQASDYGKLNIDR